MSLKDLIDRAGEDLLYYKLRNGKLIEYELSETASMDLRDEFESVLNQPSEIEILRDKVTLQDMIIDELMFVIIPELARGIGGE